jgi:hypothetical protein
MKRQLSAFAIVFFLTIPTASAWDEPPGFHGVPWGEPQMNVQRQFPAFTCTPLGLPLCRGNLMLGDFPVDTTFFFGWHGMDRVILLFSPAHFSDIAEAFIARYGQPSSHTQEPIQNRMGAHFLNNSLFWSGAQVSIRLEKYGDKDTESRAFFETSESANVAAEQRQQMQDKAKKDLD